MDGKGTITMSTQHLHTPCLPCHRSLASHASTLIPKSSGSAVSDAIFCIVNVMVSPSSALVSRAELDITASTLRSSPDASSACTSSHRGRRCIRAHRCAPRSCRLVVALLVEERVASWVRARALHAPIGSHGCARVARGGCLRSARRV